MLPVLHWEGCQTPLLCLFPARLFAQAWAKTRLCLSLLVAAHFWEPQARPACVSPCSNVQLPPGWEGMQLELLNPWEDALCQQLRVPTADAAPGLGGIWDNVTMGAGHRHAGDKSPCFRSFCGISMGFSSPLPPPPLQNEG